MGVCWPQQANIPVNAVIPSGSQIVPYLINIHAVGQFETLLGIAILKMNSLVY